MALLTIGPTRFDRAVAEFAEDRATPAAERALQVLTYAADGGVLLAAAIGFWALARRHPPRQREASTYLVINVALSAVLPHLLGSGTPGPQGSRLSSWDSGIRQRTGRVSLGPRRSCRRRRVRHLALFSRIAEGNLAPRTRRRGDAHFPFGALGQRCDRRVGAGSSPRAQPLACVAQDKQRTPPRRRLRRP